jgi:arsenate reductase
MKILILCTGNTCRSQMAHGFLQSFNDKMEVFSAGIQPGKKVNEMAVQVMKEVDIDISYHTPKLVDQYVGDEWDYVITVCDDANEACPYFAGKVSHRLHIGFDDPSRIKGTEEFILSEFRRVRDEIKNGFYKLYKNEIKPKL